MVAIDPTPEIRTRRLVVVDDTDQEWIVAEVAAGQALFRVALADPESGTCAVVLYAATGSDGLGPGLGVQLWADGNAYLEANLFKEEGRWTTDLSTGRAG